MFTAAKQTTSDQICAELIASFSNSIKILRGLLVEIDDATSVLPSLFHASFYASRDMTRKNIQEYQNSIYILSKIQTGQPVSKGELDILTSDPRLSKEKSVLADYKNITDDSLGQSPA